MQRPWLTVVGLGLSAFGGALSTIYYFKPQTLVVSTIFLGVISYVLGEIMSHALPRKGILGALLNPHPVRCVSNALPFPNNL
jgi:OPT oligopeptide transporter protein